MNNNSISKVSENETEEVEIDFSDIPEITADQMARAKLRVGGKIVTKNKIRVSMYLDDEIIAYFRARAGKRGYQTLINETLRESMRQNQIEEMLRRIIREELHISSAERL